MGATELSQHGAQFIAQFEGGQSADGKYRAYWDAEGGVWTIGIGETEGVHQGMVWTAQQAWSDFQTRFAREYAPSINALRLNLNPNQFDATGSAVWNLGVGILETSHDFGAALHRGDIKAAANWLPEYSDPGKPDHEGLLRRREAEKALMLTPWVPADPEHYGWLDATDRDMGGGRKANERETTREYDGKRKHPLIFKRRLGRLRANLTVLVDRLDHELKADPKHPDVWRRTWRRDQLRERASGRKVI